MLFKKKKIPSKKIYNFSDFKTSVFCSQYCTVNNKHMSCVLRTKREQNTKATIKRE